MAKKKEKSLQDKKIASPSLLSSSEISSQEGFRKKMEERQKLEFILRMGLIMELIGWTIVVSGFFIYFFTTLAFAETLAAKWLWFLSICYVIFHRLLYKPLVRWKEKLAFRLDVMTFLVMIILATEALGGVATPFALLFAVAIALAAIIDPKSSIIIFVIEVAIIFTFIYYIDNNQLEFVKSNKEFFYIELLILLGVSIFSYFLSRRYLETINEKQKTESLINQLIADKTKIEAILESMGDGVFMANPNKKIVLINNSAKKLIKLGRRNVLGRFYGDVFKFKTEKGKLLNYEVDCPIQQAISENRSVVRDDLKVTTTYGKEIPVAIFVAPVIDAKSNVLGGIVVLRNITYEKEMERMKYEFVSIATHELKTPVAAIAGHLSMVLEEGIGKVDDRAKKLLTRALEGAKRLSKLINDLLNVSRIEEGKMSMDIQPRDIGKIIESVISELQIKAKEKKIYLKYQKPKRRLPKVLVDEIRIREVITNLIDNAIKFTRRGGVTVSATKSRDLVTITVADTGVGISKEYIPHLFQKFHQIESAYTREAGGTGLGLYISKSIVELHKGKIYVESKPNVGSKFKFTIPIAK